MTVDEDIEKGVEEEEQPGRKFPFKWIIIGVLVMLLAGGGFVGWTMLRPPSETADGEPAAEEVAMVQEDAVGSIFAMDPFVVNLNEAGGKRYLKSKIELEFVGPDMHAELSSRLPQLRDVILLHLSSKTLEDIQSVDGKIELKNALIQRINQVLKTGKIRNIYFTQFVIQ